MISVGDTVRVIVPGKFHEQVVKVLSIDGRRMRGKEKRAYKLDVKWGGLTRASYFTEDEIVKVS